MGQCPISYSGVPCIDNPIQFHTSAQGSTNHSWNFNGEGKNDVTSSPAFKFKTTGVKTVTYTCVMPDGKSCTATLTVDIKAKPKIRVRLISDSVQCYENNMFCFIDSSLSGENSNCIKSVKYLFSDGELITKYGSKDKPVNLPSTICKTFVDPAGGNYYLVVEIEDCNGCIRKDTIKATMRVEFLPAVFGSSTALSDKCKGTVKVGFKNGSQIKRADVVRFKWDFGDGTSDSTNWDSITHTYSAGVEMNKIFSPKLAIYTTIGCKRIINFDAVSVFNLKPFIIGDKDSVCYGESINWELYPTQMKTLIKQEDVRWYFDGGFIMGYSATNQMNKLGPVIIRCLIQHQCGPFELKDTIIVIGPRAIYEPDFMDPFRRYQCVIRDSVEAVDRSQFYHNDNNFLDDDSMFSKQPGNYKYVFKKDKVTGRDIPVPPYNYRRTDDHISRLWDYDDDYCQPCIKDSKGNWNSWLNCKFSKDSIDKHWYTPWDSVYRYLYAAKSISQPYFDPNAKNCSGLRVWASDSLYMTRDTIIHYGNNNLGISAKDSVLFKSLTQKKKIPDGLFGKGILDLPFDLRVYIPAGSSVLIDKRNGSPQFQLNGPQFYNGPKDYRIITDDGDSCLFVFGLELHEDLLLQDMIQPWQRVIRKVATPGFVAGDIINRNLHRKLFYDRVPRCFNLKLTLKDTVHPFKCENSTTTPLALLPPAAKRLSMVDHFCDGYDHKVINFELGETKPGCASSFAKFNPDYINTPNRWILINDLYGGDMVMGTYNFALGKYPGYYVKGPNATNFFWVYNDTALSKVNPQSINVALIIGNGINADECADTVFYKDFANFPKLDAGIVYAGTNKKVSHMCVDTFIYVTIPAASPDDKLLADQSSWLLVNSIGDTLEMITEYYHKIVSNPRYPGKKVNYTLIERYKMKNRLLQLVKTDTLFTAIVHKWKTMLLPGTGFNRLREGIAALGMNIDDFHDTDIVGIIWNKIGTIGVPASGSKGCLDTTGYGTELDFYKRVLSSTVLNYSDTSFLPADSAVVQGKRYKAYAFRPDKKGTYSIYRSVASLFPSFCPIEKKVDLAVGFYTKMAFSDTIICKGRIIEATPDFRYFDMNPKTFGLLDTNDYWFNRQNMAGQPGKEGYTIWDFSREDDDKSNPTTIFGSMPFAKRGYRNPGMLLGNEPGGIYYHTPGYYTLRIAASDSNGCVDTVKQPLYVTGPKAGFYTDLVRPDCKTIFELFDTSYIIDPCLLKGNDPCDFIYKWTIRWGDGNVTEYLKASPKQIGHDYALNGKYRIWLTIESILGCKDSVFQDVVIPGPQPLYIPETKLTICVNDSVRFRNRTQDFSNSSGWLWNFGDGFYSPQSDTSLMYHQYKTVGQFDVYLTQFDSIANSGKYCAALYPDLASGQKKITVTVLPYDDVKIKAEPLVVCVGDTIHLSAVLNTQNVYKQYNWTFDKKIYKTSGLALNIVPTRKGHYMVNWSADTIGLNKQFCPDFDSVMVVADSVIADFTIDDKLKPVFCFDNTSKYAVSYRWGFFHDTDITIRKLEFRKDEDQKEPDRHICQNFIDHHGINWVCLEATNSLGCMDTVCKKINNDYEMGILPPNVFTPNGGDGFTGTDKEGLQGNNVFNIYTRNVEDYHLIIYDRWGVKVFESFDTQYDWNGTVQNKGAKCPDGTYYYILDYRYKGKEKKEPVLNGVVQLIW